MNAFRQGQVVFVMARIKTFDPNPQIGEVAVVELIDCEKKPMPGEYAYLPISAIVSGDEMKARVAEQIGVNP